MFTPKEIEVWWQKKLDMKEIAAVLSNLKAIRNWLNILNEKAHEAARKHERTYIGDSALEISKQSWAITLDITKLCHEMNTFLHYITDYELGIQPENSYNNNNSQHPLEDKEKKK